jgi:hypothetical protein
MTRSSLTPQFFTIEQTGTYRSTDGRSAYRLTAGSVIPMSLAIDLGIEGAGYSPILRFDPAKRARIVALVDELNVEEPASDPLIESIAVLGGGSAGQVNLPSGIQEGDLLVALAYWGSEAVEPIPGFTVIASGGEAWDWYITQYRIADGSEVSPIVPDPDWVVYSTVVARISGHDAMDPINVSGTPERTGGGSATSKTVELDSISPDIENAALLVLAIAGTGSTATSLTLDGNAFDSSDVQGVYAGGVSLASLESSGATGTRTAVVTTSGASSNNIIGAMVALNPA